MALRDFCKFLWSLLFHNQRRQWADQITHLRKYYLNNTHDYIEKKQAYEQHFNFIRFVTCHPSLCFRYAKPWPLRGQNTAIDAVASLNIKLADSFLRAALNVSVFKIRPLSIPTSKIYLHGQSTAACIIFLIAVVSHDWRFRGFMMTDMTDGTQQARKRRATKACEFCRKRKMKCDDEQPRCTNCKCVLQQLPRFLGHIANVASRLYGKECQHAEVTRKAR